MKRLSGYFVACAIVLAGCSPIATDIDWPVQESEYGTVNIAMEIVQAKSTLPVAKALDDAVELVVILTSSSYPNKVAAADITLGVGEVQIDSIRPGHWTITVHLEDVNDVILYRGEKALTVESGRTYNVRMLLEATSGIGIGFDLILEQALGDGDGNISHMDGPNDFRLSPDEKNLYVTSYFGNALLVFTRDAGTGLLTYADQCFVDGQGGTDELAARLRLTMDPDGKNVYVVSYTDDALTVFSRVTEGETTGSLTYAGSFVQGVAGVAGLNGPRDVVVSPDGKSLYVASKDTDAIAVFDRDPLDGSLTFDSALLNVDVTGIEDPNGLACSHDGKNLYVAAGEGYYSDEGDITVFDRVTVGETTGDLTFNSNLNKQADGILGLWGAFSVVVSPDDEFVYVASQEYYGDSDIVVFARNTADGTLVFQNSHETGMETYSGIATMAQDGSRIYIAASDSTQKKSEVWVRNTNGELMYGFNIPIPCERFIPTSDGLDIYGINYHSDTLFFLRANGP